MKTLYFYIYIYNHTEAMRKSYVIFIILCICAAMVSAQTLEQAKALFKNQQFEKAKPVFQKYVKNYPNNASYNYWYGACCYETGEKDLSEKYLLLGAKKKVQEAFRYLGQLYFDQYRFDESQENYETYIAMLEKSKKPVDTYEKILNKVKLAERMLKGVEKVTIIDSFVVDKKGFLEHYKISPESGELFTYDDYFETQNNPDGIVYQTELKNKLFYSDIHKKDLNIYLKNKQLNKWGQAISLPEVINTEGNENYPYVLSDGITLFYASDGAGSIGGYDIFVTRYNTNNDSYLMPDNVGMPFNSPFNDYMYVIDEYNNLGWFASDRYQPEGKVCIYVFVPNESKEIYNFEGDDRNMIRREAMIQSIRNTWKDPATVKAARQRLTIAMYDKPEKKITHDFEFVINDNTLYHSEADFHSAEAKGLFKQWRQKEKDFEKLSQKLEKQRADYTKANKTVRSSMTPGILDLEKRVEQMEAELQQLEINIRNSEQKYLSK